MKRFSSTLAAGAVLAVTQLAFAQQASGLVSVDLSTVAPTIAKNINVDASKIPVSLQVPVGVAAGACGVEPKSLAPKEAGAPAACSATATSAELDQLVHRQLKVAMKP